MVFGFGTPNVEKMSEKRDVDGLIKALRYKKDWQVREKAAGALGRIGKPAVEPLISALNDHDWGIREKAGAYWSRRRDCDRPPKTTPTAQTAVTSYLTV
jgi:hypothetical protein